MIRDAHHADHFPDYHDHEQRLRSVERELREADADREKIRDRVRDLEEDNRVRKHEFATLSQNLREWEPVIDAARDQDYLRKWIEKQELREQHRGEIRWGYVLRIVAALAAWTGAVVAIVALILKH